MNYRYLRYISTYLFFFIMTLFIISSPLSANSQLRLENNISSYTNFKVDCFIEKPGQSMGIEKVSNLPFTKEISNAFSFGYKENNFWFHFSVYNDSTEPKNMVLELTEIIHNTVDLYIVSDSLIHKKNGLIVPITEREIKESTPSFSLHFSPYENKELYIHLSSIYGVFGALHLKTEEQYKKDIQLKKYLYLFYFTSVIIIAFYNLMIFFYLKEKIYLYYIGYVLVFVLWAANYKGILFPYTNIITYNYLQITIPIFFTLFILFSQSILETKKYFPILHKILFIFILVSLVSFIWMLIDLHSGFHFMNAAAVPLFPFLIITSFWALLQKHNAAKIFLLALSVYIIGMSLLSLLALGMLDYTVLLSNSAIIGSFFEILLFSFLLAYRINSVRKESIETQKMLIEQQKTESTRLFHTVAEKTMALNLAKKELENELAKKITLEKHLQHLASTDPMTELLNRRAFFNICDAEMIKASSYERELTCLIIDIDYFKKINDTYGHDMGDKVIKTIAQLMIENTRTGDYIGRIGGEEFAVLMPRTDKESAFQISDRLRENISKHKMILNDKIVYITVSIGLSFLNHEDKSIHTLLKRADTALYEAKDNGRNQVCCI